MANSTGYYGLDPVGPYDPGAIFPFDVDPAAAAIYLNDEVKIVADQGVAICAAGDVGIGVAVGFLDSSGLPQPYYIGTGSPTGWKALVNIKRDQVYKIKCITALTAANVGENSDLVIGTGDTVTGLSGAYIQTVSAGAQTVRIIGLFEDGNNAWGANQDVLVVINENAFAAAGPAGV